MFLSVSRRGEGTESGTGVGQRRTNSCQSVRGLVLAGPFSTPVMLWLLMYPVHDVYRQSLADKRRDKKKGPRFEHNVCLPSYLEATHSTRVASRNGIGAI